MTMDQMMMFDVKGVAGTGLMNQRELSLDCWALSLFIYLFSFFAFNWQSVERDCKHRKREKGVR